MKSKNPKKQRKRFFESALHKKKNTLKAHLNKALRKELKKRNAAVRAGDTIKVMRGKHRKESGKAARVDRKKGLVFIESIKRKKADGKEVLVGIKASNLLVTEINRDDEKRFKKAGKAKKEIQKNREEKQEAKEPKEPAKEKQTKTAQEETKKEESTGEKEEKYSKKDGEEKAR